MHSAMEQSRYWMWTRRNFAGFPHIQPLLPPSPHAAPTAAVSAYSDYSWEEQAFAEDSSGRLGCCIWPPRSYSCSFCRREFRSAQALGGHMNVHRRDRARLKSSPTPLAETTRHLPPLGFVPDQITQVRTIASKISNPSHGVIPQPSPVTPPTRASLTSTQANCGDQRAISISPHPYCSPINLELPRTSTPFPSPPSLSYSFTFRAQIPLDLKTEEGTKIGCKEKRKSFEGEEKEEEVEESITSIKRPRVDVAQSNLGIPVAEISHHLRPEHTVEELDLELRLGDQPKVK